MSDEPLEVAIDVSAIPLRPAGAGHYVIELVRALAERDDVVLRLIARRGDVERWPLGDGGSILGAAPESRPLRLLYGEAALSLALRRRVHADVLHGPHYSLPLGSPLPGVVTVHDLTLIEHPEWHEASKVVFFRRAIRLARRRAEVIVVPSQFVANAYEARFGSRIPVRVVPHGVDHLRFRPGEPTPGSDETILSALGIVWPYVLSVATNEPRKNLPMLIAAFARLAESRPDLRLVLVGGSGWKRDPLEAAITASGVGERIVRPGYLDNVAVPALLRRAAAVAYPSFSEGFGLPALEAMACGAPLVTTRNSAMAEVTGDAALLVEATDQDALTVALESLLLGGEELDRRRAAGIERAGRYTWSASAKAHRDAYELALSGRRERARRTRA